MTAVLRGPVAVPAARLGTVLLTAARGAALIGVAVVLGIVLLQVVDNPTGGGGNVPATTTVTDDTGADGQNGSNGAAIDPADVLVVVLNASGVEGAAGNLTNSLMAAGWATLEPGDFTEIRQGVTVACQPDFAAAAPELIGAIAEATGGQVATGEAYPDPPPAGAENANCIVFLGAVQ